MARSNVSCQVRLKAEFVTGIEEFHAKVTVSVQKRATLTNLSKDPTSVRIKAKESSAESETCVGEQPVELTPGAVITICTRSFRFEDAPGAEQPAPLKEAAVEPKKRKAGKGKPVKTKQRASTRSRALVRLSSPFTESHAVSARANGLPPQDCPLMASPPLPNRAPTRRHEKA